jgi:hypothetical protein
MLTTQSYSTKKKVSSPAVIYQDYYNSDFYHAAQLTHFFPEVN